MQLPEMNAADLSRVLVILNLARDSISIEDAYLYNFDVSTMDKEIEDVCGIIKKELESMPVKITRGLRRNKS